MTPFLERTMRRSLLLALLPLAFVGCAGESPSRDGVELPPPPQWLEAMDALYDAELRVPGLDDRTFQPEGYWEVALPLLSAEAGFALEEVGRSAEGRPLQLVSWGEGPIPVLLWSQMHGDESTASMALVDLFHFLGREPSHPLVETLRSRTTLHFLPVMNPDGAARFQRRNAHGIDLNRDARALSTPEAQVLHGLKDRFQPRFGFNLHDQAVGTRAGSSDQGTAIALLAPPFNEAREVNDVRQRAMEVSVHIRSTLEGYVGGHMARWDDTFNPRAFGDLMTAWDVSTILIESGGWEGDPQKQFLRKLNFLALAAALESIATESHVGTPVDGYLDLPENGRRFGDLLVRGATLAIPGLPPIQADLLINFDHPLAELGGRVGEVGDLAETEAREYLDAEGLYLIPLPRMLQRRPGSPEGVAGVQIALGAPTHFRLARDPEGTDVVWELLGDVNPEWARPR